MKENCFLLLLFLLLFTPFGNAQQPLAEQISNTEQQLRQLEQQKQSLKLQLEGLLLQDQQQQLFQSGLPAAQPDDQRIDHHAISLVYSEPHEQAKWVAHIISPRIAEGNLARSNDFRPDPEVASGSAIEQDYFLRITNEKGEPDFDGFGYDRGHLVPSADFRWSRTGMSETYFYSNISPQLPDFNRKIWADLENTLRNYVFTQQVPLLVVTGPILEETLPVIDRAIHSVAIPRYFWKVAVDLDNQRGIGFLIPHQKADYPLQHFAVSIDAIEELTGLDFYEKLEDKLENELEKQQNINEWLPESAINDVAPLTFEQLPPKHYNTVVGKKQMGKGTQVYVCGTMVKARKTRSGNIMMNLDQAYPNEVFNLFINKKNLVHFTSDLLQDFQNQKICAFGEVSRLGGTPAIFLDNEVQLKMLNDTILK